MTTSSAKDLNQTVYRTFELRPNRSLTSRGKKAFYGGMVAAGGLTACFTAKAGLWPISLFIGLATAAAMAGMALSSRSGREYERILLKEDNVEIRHYQPGFRQEAVYTLPIYMLQVNAVCDHNDECQQIILRAQGKAVQIGDFLPPQERKEFAQALKQALRDMQTAHHLQPNNAGGPSHDI